MGVYCDDMALFIRADRYREAREWIVEHMDWLPDEIDRLNPDLGDGDDPRTMHGEVVRLRIEDMYGESPFWNDGGIDADELAEFCREFACAGSFFKLNDEQEDRYVLIKATPEDGVRVMDVNLGSIYGFLGDTIDIERDLRRQLREERAHSRELMRSEAQKAPEEPVSEPSVERTLEDGTKAISFNPFGDTPHEQWTNSTNLLGLALKSNIDALRSGSVGRRDGLDAIERLSSDLLAHTQDLIDKVFEAEDAAEPAKDPNREDKAALVSGLLSALSASDPTRYASWASRIEFIQSEDDTESFVIDTGAHMAACVSASSPASIAKVLSQLALGEVGRDLCVSEDMARKAVDAADRLPKRLVVTEEMARTLTPERLGEFMKAQEGWYARHPRAAARDGRTPPHPSAAAARSRGARKP